MTLPDDDDGDFDVQACFERLVAEGKIVRTAWVRRGQPVYVTPRHFGPEHLEPYVFPADDQATH